MILGGENAYYQPDDDEALPHPAHCWCDECGDPDELRDREGQGR